jgi:beta-glucuronidase
VRVEFEAVSHTATVYLNGKQIGEHKGKPYTSFICDVSGALQYGKLNVLLVRVDNAYSETMLPRAKSYDWANDGGIIRPVNILLTPPVFIERIEIDAAPDITKKTAAVNIRAIVRNTMNSPQHLRIAASIRQDGTSAPPKLVDTVSMTVAPASTVIIALPEVEIASPALWHFDAPQLYTAAAQLRGVVHEHTVEDRFGIRRFETKGTEFFLNGERVFLIGVERMAGSHPVLGMAETTEWIESNHADMKELNCVFTRVHWPQDRRVLDYCDRNGILMQEEVPAWGADTFAGISDELQHELESNGAEQMREMIVRDRNHPCIVSWGLCNEVDGKNPRSREFAHVIAKEARKLDPSRLLTYASNSLGENPGADMAGDFDFISTNEYYGSWAPGGKKEIREHLQRIVEAFPDKPIVVSEYGWCECQPSIPPGDSKRVEIINVHTQVFREFPQVAGAIYFDYNDYRTLVGDKGLGAMKQRVHGVVDIFSRRKPSFDALRYQSSPIETLSLQSAEAGIDIHLSTRNRLPAYTLNNYRIQWVVYGYDDLPMQGGIVDLPAMEPGSAQIIRTSFQIINPVRFVAEVLRPTGFPVAKAEMLFAKMQH